MRIEMEDRTVELHEGETITGSELQSFAREHLALRAPRRVLVVGSLPRSPEGKLLRRELRRDFRPPAGEP